METESSSDPSSSDCSSDSSSDDEKLETAQICGIRLQLPQGLCERTEIFREFFSANTWNQLSEIHKQHLKSFLPTFPENEEHERNVTLQKLFDGEVFRFASPLLQFHEHLKSGHYRPDIAKMRTLIKKAERSEAKYRHKLHRDRLNGDIMESRQRLHSLVKSLPPGVEPKMERTSHSTPSYINPISFRTKRRYFQELSSLRDKVDESTYSSDENFPEGPPPAFTRKQKRHLNTIKNTVLNGEKVISTVANRTSNLDLEKYITPSSNPFCISEETYKNMLLSHKRQRVEDSSDPEYNYVKLTIEDIINRTDLSSIKNLNNINPTTNSLKHHLETKASVKKKIKKEPAPPVSVSPELISKNNPFFGHSSNSELDSDSDSLFDAFNNVNYNTKGKPKKIRRVPQKTIKVEPKLEPEDISIKKEICDVPSPEKPSSYGKITPATFSDLDGIDMMNLPIDLDDSNIDILELTAKHELMQDTHANFFSLVRDIICSTDEHRMTIHTLEEHMKCWQENPISPLNDWYSFTDNWVPLLPSAINFLSGNFSEQPDDFVPYIEYKAQIDSYQWIGAGRDSDASLSTLCQYWMEHKNQMKPTIANVVKEEDVEVSDRSQTPPPPRFPTSWTVKRADFDEMKSFQEQERKRYDSPHKSFTYRCNGYESVVGPVKGIYSGQNLGVQKARGHSMLTADRPNYVTILTLVRDATARLPNGEGTRAEIVELLKCSQYISPNAPDNVLQSVVSGALDRMHTQFDPCVKYEPKRKVWIYLHRSRSEEDFERIHQQFQGMNKSGVKKSVSKGKQPNKAKPKQEKSGKGGKNTPDSGARNASPAPAINQFISEVKSVDSSTSNQSLPSPTANHKHPVVAKLSEQECVPKVQPVSPVRRPVVPKPQLSEKPLEQVVQQNQRAVSMPKQTVPKTAKSIVKIIATNQGKSLIVPSVNPPALKQTERLTPTKQLSQQQQINHQLIQTIVAQQKQLLHQQQNEKTSEEPRTPAVSENIKRNVPISVQSVIVCSTEQSVSHASAQEPTKMQAILTPSQQQQILQTLRQKVLPMQQTVINPQYRPIGKQKPTLVQVQKQVNVAGTSLLGQTKVGETLTKPVIAAGQTPLVAKVLTNAAGQVISVESLLAHQKQHGTLPHGTTLRISGTKGTPNIIQLAAPAHNSSSFTVNQVAAQPKFIASTPTTTVGTTTVTVSKSGLKTITKSQTTSKLTPKIAQQLVNAKLITQNVGQKIVPPKIIMGQQNQIKIPISTKNLTFANANTGTIRMVNAGNLNLAQLGGKPVLITSKAGAFQSLQGQNIIIQSQANTSKQSLIISTTEKPSASSPTNQVLISPHLKVQQAPQMVISGAGKPAVSLATQQNITQNPIVIGGQTVRLQTGGATNAHRVVLASQNQGQIITQQILLPVGFQGGPLNIKTLQGLKVVPIAQTQSRGVPGRPVFTRVMNSSNIVRMPQTSDNSEIPSVSKPTAE